MTMDRRLPLVSTKRPAVGLTPHVQRRAEWSQLLPAHRLPVIAKTPLIVALGIYLTGGRFDTLACWQTMGLAAALWTVLYALNEATDLEDERGLFIAGNRKAALLVAGLAVCLAGFSVSVSLMLLFVLMTAGQCAYCVKPLRWKRFWWAALLLSGGLNPVLRLECGALLGAHAIPPLAYAVFVLLHEGAAMRSRTLQRKRDARLGYHTAPAWLQSVGIAATLLGFVGAFWFCWQGLVPLEFTPMLAVGALFAVYAWSGKARNVGTLRRGWLVFAAMALIALVILFFERR